VLDEERRTLDLILIRLALLGRSRPREQDLVDACGLDPRHALGGDIGRHDAGVAVDQLHHHVAVRRRHLRYRKSHRSLRIELHRRAGREPSGFGRGDRDRLPLRIERQDESPGGVLLSGKDAEAGVRTVPVRHFGRVGAEELRRARDDHPAVVDREPQ
jgi:hypothetical protein